jgi:hypothetical protein
VASFFLPGALCSIYIYLHCPKASFGNTIHCPICASCEREVPFILYSDCIRHYFVSYICLVGPSFLYIVQSVVIRCCVKNEVGRARSFSSPMPRTFNIVLWVSPGLVTTRRACIQQINACQLPYILLSTRQLLAQPDQRLVQLDPKSNTAIPCNCLPSSPTKTLHENSKMAPPSNYMTQ